MYIGGFQKLTLFVFSIIKYSNFYTLVKGFSKKFISFYTIFIIKISEKLLFLYYFLLTFAYMRIYA